MTTKNVRAWVFIDPKVYKEIQGYAKEAGIKTNVYLNVSVVLGARTLARVSTPEKFLTPELIEKLAEEYAREPKK